MKTLRILMLALLLPAFVMTGCGDDGGGEGKPTYTVTFNADGGTPAPAVQKVTEGEKATAPATVTKTGYTFLHWSKDGAAAYDFATPVTTNFTLTAKWEVVAEPEIEIPDESELTQEAFADEETTGGFTFTAKSAWTATVNETTTRADEGLGSATRASNVEWLRLLFDGEETYEGAAGKFTLVIELDENYSGETRTATITIKSGGDTISITVTQDGKTEEGEVPVDPDPNGYAALLAAHSWYHTILADSDDTTYDDMDATIVFGRDGTISASGADSDVFTDYFVSATFEITDETFTLLMSEQDAADSMLELETLEFDIVTLTDDKFEVTGTFGSRTIGMIFFKEKPEVPVDPTADLVDGQVVTYMKSTKPREVPLIFMGEGFTAEDMGAEGLYRRAMARFADGIFEVEPFKSYKEYFTIYFVAAVSQEEGVGAFDGDVNNALGSYMENGRLQYNPDVINRYVSKVSTGGEIGAVSVIANTQEIGFTSYAVVDVPWSGGGGLVMLDAFAGDPSVTLNWAIAVFIHEFGHAFAFLADEYVTLNQGPTVQDNEGAQRAQAMGHNLNVSLTGDPTKVPWAHFIGHPNYPYVGVYEGAEYLAEGRWRSEETSLMDSEWRTYYDDGFVHGLYFNAISRELIVKRTLKIAGEEYSFDDFVAKDKYEPDLLVPYNY